MTNIKFSIRQYADISTAYLPDSDLALLSGNPLAIAEITGGYGTILHVPIDDAEGLANQLSECEGLGYSKRFCEIIQELAAQKIPYVRFDADGDEIDGLELWPEA